VRLCCKLTETPSIKSGVEFAASGNPGSVVCREWQLLDVWKLWLSEDLGRVQSPHFWISPLLIS
jgi:hypothetical protein